jgi:TRAP-type C4-dicarboxylate transport system permease small subunit
MRRYGKKILDFFEVHLAACIFILLLTSVSIEIFSRYVLNEPTPKFFELSIYAFIWTIYLGAALAKRYNQHVRFDIFYRRFPKKVRLLVDIVFDTLVNVVLLIALIPVINYTIWCYRIKASALRIPWTYLLVCFPLFMILILIHNFRDIYLNVREFSGQKVEREENLPWL